MLFSIFNKIILMRDIKQVIKDIKYKSIKTYHKSQMIFKKFS